MKKSLKSKTYYEILPISLTSDLLEIANMLQNLEQPKISELSITNVDELLYRGKLPFLDHSFNLTPIPFISYRVLQKLIVISKNKSLNLNEFIDLIDQHLITVNPFDIPILFDDMLGIEGGYCNPMYLGNNEEFEKIIFTEFVITNKFSTLTPGIYAHEIVHSQLEMNNGVKSYIHSEVLPIFFDKLTALYTNDNYETFKVNEKLRLIRLAKAINSYKDTNLSLYDKVKLSMGIVSILEAEKLFDRYLCESKNNRKNIILAIKEILLGSIQVEDLLQETNVTIDNCQDKKLIKTRLNTLL